MILKFFKLVALAGLFPASLQSQASPSRDCLVPAPELRAVLAALRTTPTDARGDVSHAYRLCVGRDLVLADAWQPQIDSEADFGPRVLLARVSPNQRPRVLSQSRGHFETYVMRLRAFESEGKVLVLAERGDESGTWGIATYHLETDSLRADTILDIGIFVPDEGLDGPALRQVRIDRLNGQWRACWDESVMLHANSDLRRPLVGSREHPVCLLLRDGRWVPQHRDAGT